MNAYASGTHVSADRSRMEIERSLARFGASAFLYAVEGPRARLAFRYRELTIRFELRLPEAGDVAATPRGRKRAGRALAEALEKEHRRRWRAIALAIKAKLVAVQDGIETFEMAFLPYLMWGGRTVAEHLLPQIESGQAHDSAGPALLAYRPARASEPYDGTIDVGE